MRHDFVSQLYLELPYLPVYELWFATKNYPDREGITIKAPLRHTLEREKKAVHAHAAYKKVSVNREVLRRYRIEKCFLLSLQQADL